MKKILQFCVLFLTTASFSQTIALETFATGFSSPVAIVNAGDDRLFVVQRGGLIRIVNPNGTVNTTPFLSLTSIITAGGERGLLGLAFHPDYATNGRFYVNYTRSGDGATVIARYNVSDTDENIANANSGEILLTIAQPFSNHNGGSLNFGPDGYLYIGMGDGGSGGDPNNYGQNLNSLLGKMLRIDVNGETGYTIPADNPYADIAGEDEIWSVGMRNPWKFSFDRQTGDLWIADVGQNAIEEINKAASSEAGLNYGWRCYEGNSPYNTTGCGGSSNYTFPVAQYTHASTGGCSLTGGYVYTGTTYPNLQNKYLFADYCNNRIGFVSTGGGAITWTPNSFTGNIASFGEDVNGELYVAGISNGIISRVVDTSLSTTDFEQNGLSLFPNPADNSFTIRNSNLLNLYDLSIYDSMGKRVASQTIDGLELTEVAIDNLSPGLYFVSVAVLNGASFTSKLMVK
ncbi:T9SS type A sorting domain-containing protein [Flavobacterium piscinae]|uniref:T9SS type A sorting domain-containing protein n=1 Tax=Flavobacterium piscinae TaxID=2506424 RepID=A0A4Q1KXD2_9FLAO|nr:PQQ-dependent sugar dehydrogenase [Flavobacterium piscinae]RXR34149.1 T9SS type A sorting domain-containing protein [Flavobacterium piscinae]